MTPSSAEAMPIAGQERRRGFWSVALKGLTPQVIGAIAILLFIRIVSANLDKVVIAADNRDLAGWLWRAGGGYIGLLVMAVPMVVIVFATANLGPQRGLARIAALGAAVVLSALAGTLLRIAVVDAFKLGSGWNRFGVYMLYVWPRYMVLGGMLTAVGEFYRRELATLRDTREAEADSARFEREMAEARLQVLQAQIEPHFIFNTLANVRRLHEKDPAAGRAMLDHLMRYLEIALPRMRDAESTLGRDVELIDAYLQIQQIRMGRRLAYSIDVPAPLRPCRVPPMMLLTLVENALKHGIGRVPDGGKVRVTARAEGEHLRLTVADTGTGFGAGSGTGTGLANIRARLAAEFGDRARLTLENNELGGATGTIELPRDGAKGSA